MKLNLVKDEMSLLIENMTEQFEMINQHESEIPQIELDIFMRNIQKLYENAIYLNKFNLTEKPVEKTESKTVKTAKLEEIKTETHSVVEEIKVEEKTEAVVEPVAEEKIEEVFEEKVEKPIPDLTSFTSEIKLNKPIAEATEKQVEAPTNVEEQKLEEKETLIPNSKEELEPTLSFDDILESTHQEEDLFSNVKANSEIVDLNNKLAEARNTQSIVEKLQSKRIESLKAVIGINDKFYFINELFAGNSQKYEDIIYTLNNFKKLEDALVYFSTLKYKFSWDEESDAYIKLSQMLERKFEMANA